VKVGRSTDYAPDTRKTRSEDWFIAAQAGRDAAKAHKAEESNPFTPHRPDWKAWREAWRCWHNHGEDLTMRFRLRVDKHSPHRIDYTEDAIHDFVSYSIAPDLPDEDRAWAHAMARETKRQAELASRATRPDPVTLRRTPEQIEREVEAVLARWPDAGITNIAVITGVMDGRLRRTRAWQRHKAAKEGG